MLGPLRREREQLVVYIGPAILIARRRGRRAVAKGMIIGAAITFILNAACWAIVYPFQTFH